MHGKPGKRAPFGNVNWSDESLPMEDRSSSGPSVGVYDQRSHRSHRSSRPGSKKGSAFGNGYSTRDEAEYDDESTHKI